MIEKDVFIYHLDNELLKLLKLEKYDQASLYVILKLLTKIAYLIAKEKIIIPASNYFESDISFKILNELKELNLLGQIQFASSSYNIEELLDKKRKQHGENVSRPNYHYSDFDNNETGIELPGSLVKRNNSASDDIVAGWYSQIVKDDTVLRIYKMADQNVKQDVFEEQLWNLPKRLKNKAFISEYMLPLISVSPEYLVEMDNYLNQFVTKYYIESFIKEYDAACLINTPVIDSQLVLPDNHDGKYMYISYILIVNQLLLGKYKGKNTMQFVMDCGCYELVEFKNSSVWADIKERIFQIMEDGNKMETDEKKNNEKNSAKVTYHIHDVNGNVVIPHDESRTNIIDSLTVDFADCISKIKSYSDEFEVEERKEIVEALEEIETEIKQSKPNKTKLEKCINVLKGVKGSAEFFDAIANLSLIIAPILSSLN